MATIIEHSVPSTFLFDQSLPPKLDINVGATSHFFQPPGTPSASTSLHHSSSSLPSGRSTNKGHKRGRDGSFGSNSNNTPRATARKSLNALITTETPQTPGTSSPEPLINTTYQLAGGLDTPTANQEASIFSPDVTCRDGGRWQQTSTYSPSLSLQIPRERNGQARLPAASPNTLRRIIQGVFGIAGHTWSFCSRNAFRGFFAGGGKGYHFAPPETHNLPEMQTSWQHIPAKTFPASQEENEEQLTSPLPGGFPDEDFIPDYFSRIQPLPPPSPSRPTKRIKQGRDSEIRGSWVMIGGGEERASSREGSPSRVSARKIPQQGSPLRTQPASSAGVAHPPLHSIVRPSFASYARSPATPSHQRPKARHQHSASVASTRSPTSRTIAPLTPKRPSSAVTHQASPLSTEVQRHAAKLQKRRKEEDASLKRWNAQLTAMIREGKEALDTRFEVDEVDDEEMTDEGYGEGEMEQFREKW